MHSEFPPDQEASDGSNRGCLGIIVALGIAFGLLCALGAYLLFQAFARLDPKPGNQPVADDKKDAPIEASRFAEDAAATTPAEMKSKNRLRRIMIAMHGHHSQFRTFPPPASASYDSAGKPRLSWRVHLLPLLDQGPLYKLFHLDEPWDSEHNHALLDKMPDVYRSRGILPDGNRTGFVLFLDPQMYHIHNRGPSIRQISDGTSNTLFVLEVGPDLAVPWTRPDDIPFDSAQPLAALGKLPKDGLWGGFADGAVRRIKPDIKPEVFRGLLTPSGGEVIQLEREVELP
jgi:hypothetical protein